MAMAQTAQELADDLNGLEYERDQTSGDWAEETAELSVRLAYLQDSISALREAPFIRGKSLSYEHSLDRAVSQMEEELNTIAAWLENMSDSIPHLIREEYEHLGYIEEHQAKLHSILATIEHDLDSNLCFDFRLAQACHEDSTMPQRRNGPTLLRNIFKERTRESRTAVSGAPELSGSQAVTARLDAAATHCANLAINILEIQRDYERPGSVSTDDPRNSQRLQMVELMEILDLVWRDLELLSSVGVPQRYTSANQQTKQLGNRLKSAASAVKSSSEAVRAALDALKTKDQAEWLFKARPALRDAAIGSLAEVSKQLRALGTTYASISTFVNFNQRRSAM